MQNTELTKSLMQAIASGQMTKLHPSISISLDGFHDHVVRYHYHRQYWLKYTTCMSWEQYQELMFVDAPTDAHDAKRLGNDDIFD